MLLTTTIRKSTHRSAFTLLEVLVVVAILVILASVATVATTRYLDDAKKSRAHLGCKGISQAVEAYVTNPANPNSDQPGTLQDLIQPPFGGPSFLRNGLDDTRTPWNNEQYTMEQATRSDNTTYMLVWTKAPDSTEISQFGIGPNARPKY